MKRKIYLAVLATVVLASGIIFWACSKDNEEKVLIPNTKGQEIVAQKAMGGTLTITYEANVKGFCTEKGKGCKVTITIELGNKLALRSDKYSDPTHYFPELVFTTEETKTDFGILIPEQIGIWDKEKECYFLDYEILKK